MSEKKGSIAIDTGALIEYLEDSALGRKFQEHVLENEDVQKFYISPLVITELEYIYCRKIGFKLAKERVLGFLKDFNISEESQLRDEAAKLKCQFAISIADCYSIALAILNNIPIYMKHEVEIDPVLKQQKPPAQIIFIDDL